jgi:uncharacterized protein (TIGR02594 family)
MRRRDIREQSMPITPTLREGDRGPRVRDLQLTLKSLTYAVDLDGVFGPQTRRAVSSFQLANGLTIDGVVGPFTAAKLNESRHPPDPASPLDPPAWYRRARQYIGTKEIAGRANNDVIMGFSRKVATRFPSLAWAASVFGSDEVPWCGAFVAYCLAEAGIEPDRQYPSALSWRDWGRPLGGPAVGAIAVKSRQGGGHVAFVAGRTREGRLAILGGNQGNMVKISPYARDAFTHYRWPANIPPPRAIGFDHLPIVNADGSLGQSEA